MTEHTTPSDRGERRLALYTLIARLLDQAFVVPGTRWRFGLDAIIGLVPGLGDAIGALFGIYGVWVARQLGVPPSVQTRMLLNLAVDALVGVVPIAGDLFDAAFKAHVRNREHIERWRANPRAVKRGSRALVLAVALLLFAVVAGTLWLAVELLQLLFRALGG